MGGGTTKALADPQFVQVKKYVDAEQRDVQLHWLLRKLLDDQEGTFYGHRCCAYHKSFRNVLLASRPTTSTTTQIEMCILIQDGMKVVEFLLRCIMILIRRQFVTKLLKFESTSQLLHTEPNVSISCS